MKNTSTGGDLRIELDVKPSRLRMVSSALREWLKTTQIQAKKLLRVILGKKEIVVGVQWDGEDLAIEQPLELVEAKEEPGKKPITETIRQILLNPGSRDIRKPRPATVTIVTDNYRLVHYVNEFKAVTYQKVWRLR